MKLNQIGQTGCRTHQVGGLATAITTARQEVMSQKYPLTHHKN